MFATNVCHTNLCHLHLQIWHVPRKCWDIWKETREQNLYLTIPALKPNDFEQDLETHHGIFWRWLGRWPSDEEKCILHTVLRWSISLDEVKVEDRGLLPCPVENQNCMLLVHCQLSWFSHKLFWKRLDYHSWYTREQTAAQHAQWQRNKSKSQDQDLVFRKLLTMSSVKTDVNPSDIGTKALGRERFHRLRSMFGMGTELSETSSRGKWYSGDEWQWKSLDTRMVDWSSRTINNMWAWVDFWNFSQCNEGRLANLTQPRDARRRARWTLVMLLHSGHITAWHSRHDSDILLCAQTSWAQVGSHRKQFSSLCTAHFAPVLCRFQLLHGSGAGIPGMGYWSIPDIVYWDIEWRWHLLKK